MDSIALGPVLDHARIRLAEKFFVETFSETFARFLHLFLDLLILFGEEILEQHIGTVTFLRVLVIDQRIIKSVNMAGSFPDSRVHKIAESIPTTFSCSKVMLSHQYFFILFFNSTPYWP